MADKNRTLSMELDAMLSDLNMEFADFGVDDVDLGQLGLNDEAPPPPNASAHENATEEPVAAEPPKQLQPPQQKPASDSSSGYSTIPIFGMKPAGKSTPASPASVPPPNNKKENAAGYSSIPTNLLKPKTGQSPAGQVSRTPSSADVPDFKVDIPTGPVPASSSERQGQLVMLNRQIQDFNAKKEEYMKKNNELALQRIRSCLDQLQIAKTKLLTAPPPSTPKAAPSPQPKAKPTPAPKPAPAPAKPSLVDRGLEIKHRPKLEKKDAPQNPEMMRDAQSGRIAKVKELLDKGADINSVDFNTGNGMLHAAATMNAIDFAKYLISKGADVNIKNRRGDTPIHITIGKRYDNFTKFLFENGGDATIKNNIGKSALNIAELTPAYYLELKEWLTLLNAKRQREGVKPETKSEEEVYVEDVAVFLKGKKKYTLRLKSTDTSRQVCSLMAQQLNVPELEGEMEIIVSENTQETVLRANQCLFEFERAWQSDKTNYFFFLCRLRRGAPSDAQRKFRQILYKS